MDAFRDCRIYSLRSGTYLGTALRHAISGRGEIIMRC
jgi:hypothetical protein